MRIIFLLTLLLSTAFYPAYAATPLMLAVENNSPEMVQALLQAGANANSKDKDGKTALMYAARNPTSDIVKILLKYGADIRVVDKNGHDAHWHACNPNIVNREIEIILRPDERLEDHKIDQILLILLIIVLFSSIIIIILFRKKPTILIKTIIPFIAALITLIVLIVDSFNKITGH